MEGARLLAEWGVVNKSTRSGDATGLDKLAGSSTRPMAWRRFRPRVARIRSAVASWLGRAASLAYLRLATRPAIEHIHKLSHPALQRGGEVDQSVEGRHGHAALEVADDGNHGA